MIFALILLLLPVSSAASTHRLSHPLSVESPAASPRATMTQPDTLHVLAALVQFQEDADTRTSGNGRFDLSAPTQPVLDAPPRDSAYFRNHLAFAASYFRKVSGGRQHIDATVLGRILTLPAPMAAYSPPRGGTNRPVGDLAVDTWRLVDSLGLVPDFARYDCFIVFHAGAGRDIDLVNTLGYDPTPFDIPSLYLGLGALRSFYGPGYEGIPVAGGTFHITNTAVLPETESRLLPGISGDVLLELSINGLLCASIGNHLGLPDLFDTRTGRSGIGRFGLMDGQAIFSFAGAFPPEPSAWEKYWLGWIEPITLGPGEHALTLPAAGTPDTVYRIPISAQEYYLLENRNRDPGRNGQTVTYVYNGETTTRTFLRDTTDFNAFDVDALAGVVTDVEDPDWSLPGGRTADGTFFDGGVLIWHIDETVIAGGLAAGGVNADPLRRGVDVEEADGSQDIGQVYGFLSPGSGSEEGTPLDFWYEGNAAPVYRNRFSHDTHPNSQSNSGARTHITIRDFGPRSPQATVVVVIGDDQISPVPGFPKRLAGWLSGAGIAVESLVSSGPASFILSSGNGVFAWDPQGGAAMEGGESGGRFIAPGASIGYACADLDGDGVAELVRTEPSASFGSVLRGYRARDLDGDSLAEEIFTFETRSTFGTTPIIGDSLIAVGSFNNRAWVFSHSGVPVDSSAVNTDPGVSPVVGGAILPGANRFCFVSEAGTVSLVSYGSGRAQVFAERRLGAGFAAAPAVGRAGSVRNNALFIALLTAEGSLFVLDSLLNDMPGFPLQTGAIAQESPALADVDGDGATDIVVLTGARIGAYNLAGALLDQFPVSTPGSVRITSNPVVGDVDGDGRPEVVAVTENGLVLAYDARGRQAPGFPLQAGTGRQFVALRVIMGDFVPSAEVQLAVASFDTNAVSAWITGRTWGPIPAGLIPAWGQFGQNARRTGLAPEPDAGTPLSRAFLPEDRAYNWPNPVYGRSTFIRYFVRESASVSVRIFDLAGDLVAEFSGPGVGGVDNEVAWDVSDVQSGVYFARIEASGGGENAVAVVKVAVVK